MVLTYMGDDSHIVRGIGFNPTFYTPKGPNMNGRISVVPHNLTRQMHKLCNGRAVFSDTQGSEQA